MIHGFDVLASELESELDVATGPDRHPVEELIHAQQQLEEVQLEKIALDRLPGIVHDPAGVRDHRRRPLSRNLPGSRQASRSSARQTTGAWPFALQRRSRLTWSSWISACRA